MKHIKQIILAIGGIFLVVLSLGLTIIGNAGFSWGGERIVKIAELPNTDDYTLDGEYVDIGIIFKQFEVIVPLINYDKRWCVFSGNYYWEFSKAELDDIATSIGIFLPSSMELPFWDVWGGKLTLLGILVGVFLLGLIFVFFNKHRDENIVKCIKCKRKISLKNHNSNAKIKCHHCGSEYYFPLMLNVNDLKIPLFPGKVLFHDNIVIDSDKRDIVGEVFVSDDNSDVFCLKNKSAFLWTITKPNGVTENILPDYSFSIEKELKIEFNGLIGVIN